MDTVTTAGVCVLNGPVSSDVPARAAAIIQSWETYSAALAEFTKVVDELRGQEKRMQAPAGDEGAITVLDCSDVLPDRPQIVERFTNALVCVAAQHFAPLGAKLSVYQPQKEVIRRHAETFDARALWDRLEAQYGGGRGAYLAYHGEAKKLVSELSIRAGTEPKVVTGRIVLKYTTHPDDRYGEVLGLHDDGALVEIVRGFEAVGSWAGVMTEAMVADCARIIAAIRYCNRKQVMERMAIGDSVQIIPYISKWEFRLSAEFAERLMAFLGQFDAFGKM